MRLDSEDVREIDRQRLLQGNVGVLFAFGAVTNYSWPKATRGGKSFFSLILLVTIYHRGKKERKVESRSRSHGGIVPCSLLHVQLVFFRAQAPPV